MSFTSPLPHQACPPPPGCPQANDSDHDEDNDDKHEAIGANDDEDEESKEGKIVYLLPSRQELFLKRGLLLCHLPLLFLPGGRGSGLLAS